MSATKGLNNRLDYLERGRVELEDKVADLSKLLASVRSENTRLRAESRGMADQLDRIGSGLKDFLTVAEQAAEDRPGHAPHAARVRQARACVELFNAVIGECQ